MRESRRADSNPPTRRSPTFVYVLNSYHPGEASHFAHVGSLLSSIAKLGIRVLLVIEKHAGVRPEIGDPRVKTLLLPKSSKIRRMVRLFHVVRRLATFGAGAVFVRIAALSACASILATRGRACRVFFWQSGTTHDQVPHRRFSLAWFRWMVSSQLPFRLALRGADRFVTGPERMVDYYRDRFGLPAERVVCLYNDIDTSRFRPPAATEQDRSRAELSLDSDAFLWLFVHRLSPVRRSLYYLPWVLTRYLEAAGDLAAGDEFLIVGGGPETEALREAVRDAGLEHVVSVIGSVPNEELGTYYRAADAFLNPSWAEGFPRVLLEAMAAGLPIVSTDAGGTRDVLGTAQQDFVTDIADREGFADSMLRLRESRIVRGRLRKENLTRVDKFSTPRVARMYAQSLFGSDVADTNALQASGTGES